MVLRFFKERYRGYLRSNLDAMLVVKQNFKRLELCQVGYVGLRDRISIDLRLIKDLKKVFLQFACLSCHKSTKYSVKFGVLSRKVDVRLSHTFPLLNHAVVNSLSNVGKRCV